MMLAADLIFGDGGNARHHQLQGWAVPERGFTWAIDSGCSLCLAAPLQGKDGLLELDVVPFVAPPLVPNQRLSVMCGTHRLGGVRIDRPTRLAFNVPAAVIAELDEIIVSLTYPDAAAPAALGHGDDHRRLGVMVRALRLFETAAAGPVLPYSLAPLPLEAASAAALNEAVHAHTGLATGDLLHRFESLGSNCEFGLMQREFDAEPLGLLRFGGIEPEALMAGLAHGFAGIDDPHRLGLESGRMNGRDEYLVRDAEYGLRLHTGQFIDEVPPESVDLFRMARHLGFLQRHFAEGLRQAERIFVLHHPDIADTPRALPVLARLRAHGDNTLLYVTAHPAIAPGTVVQERAHLLHGYTDRLVPMNEARMMNLAAWISLCANAYVMAGKIID